MLTNINPAAYDRDSNLLVPRYGIRIAFGLAFLTACASWLFSYLGDKNWHEQHPGHGASGFSDPLWMIVLWIALPLLPFVLSGLLLSARGEGSIAAGAGIAASLLICSLGFSFAALVGTMFLNFFPGRYDLPGQISTLLFIASSLWIIVSAFRIGAKAGWGVFFLTAGACLFCMALAYHFLESTERKLDRENEQRKREAVVEMFKPARDAQHRLVALGGCLILDDSIHPQSGIRRRSLRQRSGRAK